MSSVSRSSQLKYTELSRANNLLSVSLEIMRDPESFLPDERISNSSPILDGAITTSNNYVQNYVGPETTTIGVVEGILDALFRLNNNES
jgi:hypothetical protein